MSEPRKPPFSSEEHAYVLARIPTVCVDVVLSTPAGVLLGVRQNEPEKGNPWLIGGSAYFGETFEQTGLRKVKEETGFDIKLTPDNFVGIYSYVYTQGQKRHTDAAIYFATTDRTDPVADAQHKEFVFVKELRDDLRPYVRQALIDSNVFRTSDKLREPIKPRYFSY